MHEGLGYAPDSDLARRVQQVKVFDSMAHLQQSIYLSYPDALGGWNEPGESIKLLGSEGSSTKMVRVLLAHEYGHVASFEMGEPINDAPWWVLEGVAELAAQRYAGSWTAVDRTVRGWAKAGLLSDWALLADFRGEARNHIDRVYTQGHHMVGYVSSLAGRDGRNAWLRAMARGLSLDQATREALGMTFEELDRRWRESLLTPAPRREPQPDAEPEPEPEPAGAQP
ncbi:hypothetical protein J4558_27165 [Leptolyngbya sp. 15MV]|nr:hypothetical protein J4558_27165 [Leptolyngbya sp. 15MV]